MGHFEKGRYVVDYNDITSGEKEYMWACVNGQQGIYNRISILEHQIEELTEYLKKVE